MGDYKIGFCSGIAELCLFVCLSPGKTYSLIYARVHVEDAAEIKFVAEKAESRAHLTVKGNSAVRASTASALSCYRPIHFPYFGCEG